MMMASINTTAIRKRNWTPYLFLAVPLTLYIVWIIAPTFYTMYLSMTNWDGISVHPDFIGLANYERLFKDRTFLEAFWNNVR
ncbi:MAG: sugar ABC transporter permease, partial [Anaerolineae bacterium]|nr:sugar ABC transporter permease [Anaerolineae bacterium]